MKSQHHVKLLLPSLGIISLVAMRHFAPWALECVEEQSVASRPKRIHLKYLTDVDLYSINLENGFSQYEYVWDRDVGVQRDTLDNESGSDSDGPASTDAGLDDKIDGFRLGTRINDEANRKIESAAMATVTVNIFDEVDCLVYCSKTELKMCVELPFPPSLSPLREELSVFI